MASPRHRTRRTRLPGRAGRHLSGANPIVIGGCGRSGTTLLRVMLDSHPHICCGPESGLFLAKPIDAARLGTLARKFDMEPSRLRAMFETSWCQARFIECFFEYYCELTQKRRWAEKTPRNVRALDFVFGHFPNARFVHVIRDGRDVVCSLRTHPRFEVVDGRLVQLNTRNPIGECIERWVRDVRAGLAFRNHPAAIEIRYEDLVREPKASLERLLENLGEPWDDRVLSYHEQAGPSRDVTKFPQNREATRPLSSSSIGRWRVELAPEEAELFKRRAGQLLIQLGYAQDLRWEPSQVSDLESRIATTTSSTPAEAPPRRTPPEAPDPPDSVADERT